MTIFNIDPTLLLHQRRALIDLAWGEPEHPCHGLIQLLDDLIANDVVITDRIHDDKAVGGTGRPIDFVVAGTPKAGTTFITKVVKMLGPECGHENYLRATQWTTHRSTDKIWGDVSYECVPHLHCIPKGTRVITNVRHPVDTINSLIGSGLATRWRACIPWLDIMPMSDKDEAIFFWTHWYSSLAHYQTKNPLVFHVDRPDDLREELDLFCDMVGCVEGKKDISLALEAVPTNTNTKGPRRKAITWKDLPERAVKLAVDLGYHP